MELLNAQFDKFYSEGRLAVKDCDGEDVKVYVVWQVKDSANIVRLVELDRPQDGENHWVDLNVENVYLLEPREVVERVSQWI